jgi:hypothetical protein
VHSHPPAGQPAHYPGAAAGPPGPYAGVPGGYPGQLMPQAGVPGGYPGQLVPQAGVAGGYRGQAAPGQAVPHPGLPMPYAGRPGPVGHFAPPAYAGVPYGPRYLQVSEDEITRGVERITRTGPLMDLAGYLFLGTGIAFIIWLYRARENTEIFKPRFAGSYQGGYNSGSGAHRHAKGWAVGGWFCPIVQFWYPLQVVQDVVSASEPSTEPGAAKSGGIKALLSAWWASWTVFWVLLTVGGSFAGISFIVWMVRLVDAAEAADNGGTVDIYDLQTFMIRVALGVDIGFTVAAVALIVAAVTIAVLMLRVGSWQQATADALIPQPTQASSPLGREHPAGYPQPGPASPQDSVLPEPPQYAPRQLPGFTTQPPPKTFPSYSSPQQPDDLKPRPPTASV